MGIDKEMLRASMNTAHIKGRKMLTIFITISKTNPVRDSVKSFLEN
jgi:hypothetical protein